VFRQVIAIIFKSMASVIGGCCNLHSRAMAIVRVISAVFVCRSEGKSYEANLHGKSGVIPLSVFEQA
jgi:hypothetical protein